MARQPSKRPPAESPSWVKQQTLKILRSLITRLQAIADRLETSPFSAPQRPLFPLWNQLLRRLRGWLPAPWNRKINDFDLSLALGAIITLSLVISVSFIPRPTPEVAQVPETPEPTETVEVPELEIPEIEAEPEAPPEAIAPEPEPIPEEIPEPVPEPVEEEITKEPEPELEPLEIAETEEPVEETEELVEEEEEVSEPVPVEIAPPPPPVLTPEQRLIATIQEQVNRLTEKYEEGLIDSLQADFLNSLLVLKVDRRWYSLPLEQQKRLANDMLRRSRKLDFSRLEILDLQGHLLARNSLVGRNMVILKAQAFDAIAK